MAQLVERRVRNAKARGSNPLISTKISYILYDIFLYKGIMCDKITLTALAVRTPMPGLTLTLQVNLRVSLLRKLLVRFLRIPLSPPKISHILCDIFLYKGIMCDKITLTAIAVRTPMPGLTASKERRKRNAFAEIECNGHSKQITRQCKCAALVRMHNLFCVDASHFEQARCSLLDKSLLLCLLYFLWE